MFEVALELHNGLLSQIPHLTHKPSKLFFRGFAGFQLSFVNEKPFPAQRDRIALELPCCGSTASAIRVCWDTGVASVRTE